MRALFARKDLRLLFGGQTVSMFGDWMMIIVLGIWAKTLTGSSSQAGLVFLVFGVTGLVAPFGRFEQHHDSAERAGFSAGTGSFSVLAGEPTVNVHMAFPADDNSTVDEFHAALTEAGYRDNGAPGERTIYHPGYYGAFVLDPDGNNVEIVCHNREAL